MSKEILRIYRDKSGKIIYQFQDEQGFYNAGDSWKDTLNDIRESSCKGINYKNGNAYFAYEGLTLRIDNYVDLLDEELMDYLGPSVLKSIYKRVKNLESKIASRVATGSQKVSMEPEPKIRTMPININQSYDNNKNYMNNNNRSKSPRVKCKRNNKYSSLKHKVIVGSLILAALTSGAVMIYGNSSKEITEPSTTTRVEVTSDINLDLGIPRFAVPDFKTDLTLDINDFDQGRLEKVIPYEDRSEAVEATNVIDLYETTIKNYAERCGIDPKIMYAIAAQESAGKHEYGLTHGSMGGLFQIEMNNWKGKTISYYDLKDKDEKEIKVTDDIIKSPERCIEIACALMQDALNRYHAIPLAIQEYNMGYYNLKPVLQSASQDLGVTSLELYNDETCPWKNYLDFAKNGDKGYLDKVLSFAGFGYNTNELTCTLINGQTITCSSDTMFQTAQELEETSKAM